MRIFALALALLASSNLLAVVFPNYVAKPLIYLDLSKGVSQNGITMAAKYLNQPELVHLFGSHADNLVKKFRIIQCTVKNETNNDFRIVGNQIQGLELVKAADVASVLNPLTWTRLAATTGLPLVGSFLSEGFARESQWGDLFSYEAEHWRRGELFPSLGEFVEPTAFGLYTFPKMLLEDPVGIPSMIKLMIKFPQFFGRHILFSGILPFSMWTTAAVSLYKSYKTSQLIKQDLAHKILSADDPKLHFLVVEPHKTKSFLLVSPIELPVANKITISGITVPVD